MPINECSSKRKITVDEFYAEEGQKLINACLYPDTIKQHLMLEKLKIRDTLKNKKYDAVIEVGCMDGSLHFDVISECDVNYFGIDLINQTIEKFKDKISIISSTKFMRAQVLDINQLRVISTEINHIAKKTLVIFPFNSFGNLHSPAEALSEIRYCGYDVCILTYQTNRIAFTEREIYYTNCRYKNLTSDVNQHGALFSSADGLYSYAYHANFVQNSFQVNQFKFQEEKFGEIGVAYLGFL